MRAVVSLVSTQCALGNADCAYSDHLRSFGVNRSTICIPDTQISSSSSSHSFAHIMNILTDGGEITENSY